MAGTAAEKLEPYRRKRDFSRSPEPSGTRKRKRSTEAGDDGGSFVIQKHAARRLHYDFRLEMDGVLKSWAVTRGPSLDPHEKRLAVHVEDHPIDYGSFEGTIPKGEYGGGTVVLWDRGRWTPVGDPHRGYAKGHMEFTLAGSKLRGRWHLVRLARKSGETRDNWLLIKAEDEEARPSGSPDILDEQPDSVATGRTLEAIATEEPGWSSKTGRIQRAKAARSKPASTAPPPSEPAPLHKPVGPIKGARKTSLPAFVPPALASLATAPPRGARWLHEIKFDGYRIQARLDKGRVRLMTRTGLDWTNRFGTAVAESLAKLPATDALLDGELVVENGHGASDFSALQNALSAGETVEFRYYVFDLLHLDGQDLTGLPLTRRRQALEALLETATPPLFVSGTFPEDGDLILKHACRLSLEGIVSKLKTAPYRQGRGKTWVKSKCARREEFVVGGYMPSSTARNAVGSLLLGHWDRGKFTHVGRVGTGFSTATARDLFTRLQPLRQARSPFATRLTADESRQAVFVAPEIVVEVEYRAWTADRHLRHAAFRGLREDKPAREVERETEVGVADDPERHRVEPEAEQSPSAAPTEKAPGAGAKTQPAPRTRVRLTHPDRVYWPDAGVTKEGLADYYAAVWRPMAPFLVDRPLSLVRCPGGIVQQCFFQKHAWAGAGAAIRRVPDPAAPKDEPLIAVHDLDGLMSLVQGGVLEIHPWGSTLAAVEQPDMLIFDLDPGDGVSWPTMVDAAGEVRERLKAVGLASFVKTSGGKGLHVVAPLRPSGDWVVAKAFTKAVAEAMAADSPDRFVAVVTKAKRRGRILVDYLRNGRGATAVAAYSTRARPGAPVSMPLGWDDLDTAVGANQFTVANAPARLNALDADPWVDFRRAAAPLPGSEAAPAPRKARKAPARAAVP